MTRFDVIKERLLLDSEISTLTLGKIYNQNAPTEVTNTVSGLTDKTAFPFIIIRQIGSQSSPMGNANIRDYIYVIESYNTIGLDRAEILAKHVKNALNNNAAANLAHAETEMMFAFLKSEVNYYTNEGGDIIHQCDVNVQIRFKETI